MSDGHGGPDTVVFPRIDETRVYQNDNFDIVIRQVSCTGEDDQVVLIPRQFLQAFIEALEAEKD